MRFASATEPDEQALVLQDVAGGRLIGLAIVDGRQVISLSCQVDGREQVITLTDDEVAEILMWKNSGRRNSFWNWPGWTRYGIEPVAANA